MSKLTELTEKLKKSIPFLNQKNEESIEVNESDEDVQGDKTEPSFSAPNESESEISEDSANQEDKSELTPEDQKKKKIIMIIVVLGMAVFLLVQRKKSRLSQNKKK